MKAFRGHKLIPLGPKKFSFLIWNTDLTLMNLSSISQARFVDFLGTDLVVIHTEKPIAPPIPLARQAPQAGDSIYMVGYPSTTTDRRQNFGVPDSKGLFELSFTKGRALTTDEALSRLSKLNAPLRNLRAKLQSDPALAAKWNQQVLFSDADANDGSSGSPILNAAGELVAIQSARMIEYRGADPGQTISFGLRKLVDGAVQLISGQANKN
jgi:S1-C subfamily serine protease